MRSILITGCNRGIGLGLIRTLLNRSDSPRHVIGTCRNLDKATELKDLSRNNDNLHVLEIDLKDINQYDDLSKRVEKIVDGNGLNVLFNNAGVSPKYTRLPLVKIEQLNDTFLVNVIAPIMLSKALLPQLKSASKLNASSSMSCNGAAIINMSSILGSIESNADGGLYPYKCSKAALNMATKSMSIDLRKDNILSVSIHPGWVKTGMGGTNAPMDVETSSREIVNFLYNLNETHNGGFYQYDGKKLPW